MKNNNSILAQKQYITQLKNNQTRIQRLFSFDQKIQNNICDCGRYIQLNTKRNYDTAEIKKEVEQAYTCKYRYCPLCNYYRICSLSPQMIKALEDRQNKGNKILFLTLTVPNCDYSNTRKTISEISIFSLINILNALLKRVNDKFYPIIRILKSNICLAIS